MISPAIVVATLTLLANSGHPVGSVDAMTDLVSCGPTASALQPLPSGTRLFAIASLRMRRVHDPQPLPDAAAGVPRIIAQADGDSAVIEPVGKLCAYPPGVVLPAWLQGKAPDLVIP